MKARSAYGEQVLLRFLTTSGAYNVSTGRETIETRVFQAGTGQLDFYWLPFLVCCSLATLFPTAAIRYHVTTSFYQGTSSSC